MLTTLLMMSITILNLRSHRAPVHMDLLLMGLRALMEVPTVRLMDQHMGLVLVTDIDKLSALLDLLRQGAFYLFLFFRL